MLCSGQPELVGWVGAGSCRPGDAFLFACVGYEHVEPRGQEAEIQTCSGSQVLKRKHLGDCALVTGQCAALMREGIRSRLFTCGLDCWSKPAFLQLGCGFSRTCRESRPCWTHVAERCPAVPGVGLCQWRGWALPGVQGLRPTLPPAGQPCSPGHGCSSSPGRGLGALELVPAAPQQPGSPVWLLCFPLSCLGLCVRVWLHPPPSQSACGFGAVRLADSDVSPPAPLPAAATLWNPDAEACPRHPRWGLGDQGAASHSARAGMALPV